MWAAQFLTHKKPHTIVTSGGAGTMGYGLPAAIGAQVGAPEYDNNLNWQIILANHHELFTSHLEPAITDNEDNLLLRRPYLILGLK